MKRIASIFLVICLLFTMAGCSGRKNNHTNTAGQSQTQNAEVPIYHRTSSPFFLAPKSDRFMICSGPDGMLCYGLENPSAGYDEENGADYVPRYFFSFQAYDKSSSVSYGTITGGLVADVSTIRRDEELRTVVLHLSEDGAHLVELSDIGGWPIKDLILDTRFDTYEKEEQILALDRWNYVISLDHEVFLINVSGEIEETVDVRYTVQEFLGYTQEKIYALGYDKSSVGNERYLLGIDRESFRIADTVKVEDEVTGVYLFEDGLMWVYRDRIEYSRPDREDARTVIDLDRQGILSSEIVYLYGTHEEYRIVTLDQSSGCLLTLTESEEETAEVDMDHTEDGRRIVRVAVSEDYLWDMKFHAKKYNSTSDTAYVEVEVLNEPMEFYLGKGNQPDVIGFFFTTDFAPYIEKKALADMMPLFEAQDRYSLDEFVPKVKELLTDDDGGIYHMATNFQLLLRTSDGTEYDRNGDCDIYRYLQWRDNYMAERNLRGSITKNIILGLANVNYLLYANLGYFYDEESAEVYFSSDSFQKLMKLYKDTSGRRAGELNKHELYYDHGTLSYWILRDPTWYGGYGSEALTCPNGKMAGVPGIDGKEHVLMRLECGMGILETSQCKQEAFDFLMYISNLKYHLCKGNPEWTYGRAATPMFSVIQAYTDEVYDDGLEYQGGFFYTEEQLSQLRYLFDVAETDTLARKVIFDMMMEEMDPYLNGNKDLDSACEILDSRVRLYLQERQ